MRRAILVGSVVALLGLMLAAPPPGVAATDATGTVRAVVRYHTGSGTRPLAGVEVWLGIFDGTAEPHTLQLLRTPCSEDL